jgi:hypothetical protein
VNQSATVPEEVGAQSASLAEIVGSAHAETAQSLAERREARDRLQRELAAAEAAVAEAEEAGRRRLETTVRAWCAVQAGRSAEALDRAAAWSIAAELEEIRRNRDVVLDTIHPSLHGEISQTFDRRIAELEERASAHQSVGEDAAPPEPVVVGAVWVLEDPPAVGAVMLGLGAADLDAAARAAFSDLVGGEVRTGNGTTGATLLTADVEPGTVDAADAARVLSRRISELMAATEGWPPALQALVQHLEGDAARAIATVVPPRAEGG